MINSTQYIFEVILNTICPQEWGKFIFPHRNGKVLFPRPKKGRKHEEIYEKLNPFHLTSFIYSGVHIKFQFFDLLRIVFYPARLIRPIPLCRKTRNFPGGKII